MPSLYWLTNQNTLKSIFKNDLNSKKTRICSINQHLFKNNFIFRPPFILRTSIFGFTHNHKISFRFRVINDYYILVWSHEKMIKGSKFRKNKKFTPSHYSQTLQDKRSISKSVRSAFRAINRSFFGSPDRNAVQERPSCSVESVQISRVEQYFCNAFVIVSRKYV